MSVDRWGRVAGTLGIEIAREQSDQLVQRRVRPVALARKVTSAPCVTRSDSTPSMLRASTSHSRA